MSLYAGVQEQIKEAYGYLQKDFDESLLQQVLYPDRVLEVNIPVRMDDGSLRTFTGYRSQHNNVRGPYKGGIRYHQDVSKDEVMSLSAWMSIKCSVVGIPLGGGKGGIIVNPKELSVAELERLTRGYARKLGTAIGPYIDVPAPDVNTNPQIMAWIADEYSKIVNKWTPGVITGKPLTIGGSAGRGTATATGAFITLRTFLEKKNESLVGKRIAIQGAGNAGLHFARLVSQYGGVVVAISDSRGGIYNASGLDIESITELKANHQSVSEYQHGDVLQGGDIFTIDCDIMVPAALENVITMDNYDTITAPLIMEIANGPLARDADEKLYQKGITVIPDILANAGGVTVSYFEQVQNNANFYRSANEVAQRLEDIMVAATTDVIETAANHNISLRDAAYVVSLRRILAAMKDRGMSL